MPSEISKLYDEIMANSGLGDKAIKEVLGRWTGKVHVSGTPRTPAPTRQNLERGIATDLSHCLRKRLPVGMLARSVQITSREENGKIVFEASVEVPVPKKSAIQEMRESIDGQGNEPEQDVD